MRGTRLWPARPRRNVAALRERERETVPSRKAAVTGGAVKATGADAWATASETMPQPTPAARTPRHTCIAISVLAPPRAGAVSQLGRTSGRCLTQSRSTTGSRVEQFVQI